MPLVHPLALVLPQSRGPAGRGALADALARCHRVISFDSRGSERRDPAAGYDMETLAGNLMRVLDAEGFTRTALVCHSTGCGVGIALAAAHPERVAALVLAAPWSHGDPYLAGMQNLRKEAARALPPEPYARFNAALLFPPEFRNAHAAGFARMAREAVHQPQDAVDLARRLDAIVAFDARPLWPRIACPTLVLVARDDQLMPPWHARDTARGIVGARLIELDGGGHMLPETRTGEFVDAVTGFVAEAVSAGA